MVDHPHRHQQNMVKIFYPQSLAVIGTNKVKGTVPHDILVNILKANFQEWFILSARARISSIRSRPTSMLSISRIQWICNFGLPQQCLPYGVGTVR
jgi:hypothetical protein